MIRPIEVITGQKLKKAFFQVEARPPNSKYIGISRNLIKINV